MRPGLGIGLALTAGLLNAVLSQLYRKQGDEPRERAGFHIIVVWSRFLLCFVLLGVIGAKPGSWAFIGTSTAGGVLQSGNFIFVLRGIMMGPVAIAWAIVWLAAPLVGILWAIFPANEAWSPFQYAGVGLFIVCLPILGISTYLHNREIGQARPIRRFFLMFMVIGMVFGALDGYCNKLSNDYAGFERGSEAVYLSIISLITAVGFSLFHVMRGQKFRFTRVNLLYGGLAGALVLAQLGAMVFGLQMIEAARFFPAVASTAIVLSAIFSAIWQKESPSVPMMTGIALSIGAIVLFALG